MTIKTRVERLEDQAGKPIKGDPGDPPPIILHWPEDETPETRAARRQAWHWFKEHGQQPEGVTVNWDTHQPEGTPALNP